MKKVLEFVVVGIGVVIDYVKPFILVFGLLSFMYWCMV